MISVDQELFPIIQRLNREVVFDKVLDELNHPEKFLKVINVVGTNGKGSTSFYLSKGLLKKYQKVGLFISPAFLYQNERIQINNTPISDNDLKSYLHKIDYLIKKYQLHFFEIWTLIMILYFKDQKVDIVVCEAGIGGIRDTTSFLTNQLFSLCSSISYDHMDMLGNSIDQIIYNKINIAKPNTKLFISHDNLKYKNIINKQITNKNVELIYTDLYEDKIIYQKANKGLVKKVLEELDIFDLDIFELEPPLGRFTTLQTFPNQIIIDGAHNVDGIKKLIQSVKSLNKEFIVLYASITTKEYLKSLELLDKNFKEVYICEFDYIKSWSIEHINHKNKIKDWKNFLKNNSKNIIICGSLYFIPLVYTFLKNN
ncbi:Mur ligase family protein [Mycoplasma capricolum]|uniref:Mur ligase family protein n=1 Tax=Mycoplasma capricolum TaxID=2095 RepID=UPI0022F3A56E|nr:Mur ligase family protein [Mycoplasma capricolum]WBX36461.1 Mur ligase family protein [Mycoplasma capricolum subsp. capricolum]